MNCRNCEAPLPKPFLDLGITPLANSYLKQQNEPAIHVRLAIAFCKKCYLVQLTHAVPPAHMFTDYAYSSGYSTTFLDHLKEMAITVMRDYLPDDGKVLE